jgi:hypothetical protein
MLTAIAVVPRYRLIVLNVMLPRLVKLLREEMPDTSEKKTNGTINILRRFIKIDPPRLKI